MGKVSTKAMRAAVVRIAAGLETEAEAARRLGVHRSTISRKVKEIGPSLQQKPAEKPVETPATPATPELKKTEKTPLEIAREAAQGTPAPEIAHAVAQAGLDDAKFCIDTIQNYKAAGVYLVAQFSGVPGAEPSLPAIGELSEMAKGVIAQNASWLAPMLRQQGGKEALYVILGIEALLAYAAIRGLAQAAAKKRREKAEAEEKKDGAA